MEYPYDQRGNLIEVIILAALENYDNSWRGQVIREAERKGSYRTYARLQISRPEWVCLDELWQKESSWQSKENPHLAKNPNSSAYGIPQALPGKKMATAGSDWQTNPITQVKWGLNYIKERYGNECTALKFHKKNGWY